MINVKRILVGLDLSEMDAKLIKYCHMLAGTLRAERVYFVHISKNLELPDQVRKEYPDLLAPMDETIRHEIQSNLKENWQALDFCEVEVEVKEGNPADKIVRWTKLKEVDLLVMGKKTKLSGSGIVPNKIAKIMHTSMLLVPEDAEIRLERIFVPIDFSGFSAESLKLAQQLSEQINGSTYVHYAYNVPSGYHKTGKSFDEFAHIMRKHAESDMKRFLEKHQLDKNKINITLSLDKSENAAGEIRESALNHKADLIIMSSKGKTGIASVLLGSVTEKLITLIDKVPLMILKDRKESLSFLDVLMKI